MTRISRLDEIHQIASEKTSEALSKLTGFKIQIDLEKWNILNLKKVTKLFEPKEKCVGIFCEVRGDISGGSWLIFSEKEARLLSDLLVRRNVGTAQKISKLDQGVLEELGNIISGAYLNILGDQLQVSFEESPPVFHQGPFELLCGGTFSQILESSNESNIITVKLHLYIEAIAVNGYLLVTFSSKQMELLLSLT